MTCADDKGIISHKQRMASYIACWPDVAHIFCVAWKVKKVFTFLKGYKKEEDEEEVQ
jgi:hypothetical protein